LCHRHNTCIRSYCNLGDPHPVRVLADRDAHAAAGDWLSSSATRAWVWRGMWLPCGCLGRGVDDVDHPPVGCMLKPELNWIDSCGCRCLIDQRFEREVLLALSGRAHDEPALSGCW